MDGGHAAVHVGVVHLGDEVPVGASHQVVLGARQTDRQTLASDCPFANHWVPHQGSWVPDRQILQEMDSRTVDSPAPPDAANAASLQPTSILGARQTDSAPDEQMDSRFTHPRAILQRSARNAEGPGAPE
jgi:hypothetical protein